MLGAHSPLPASGRDHPELTARIGNAPSEQHPRKAAPLIRDRSVVYDQKIAGVLRNHEPFVPASVAKTGLRPWPLLRGEAVGTSAALRAAMRLSVPGERRSIPLEVTQQKCKLPALRSRRSFSAIRSPDFVTTTLRTFRDREI